MHLDPDMQAALQVFILESQELLQDMETALQSIFEQDDYADSVNAIFRAAHTIKGSAGLFGLDAIVAFTHVVESALDNIRSGALPVSSALIAILLPCRDHIEDLVSHYTQEESSDDSQLSKRSASLIGQLQPYLLIAPASKVIAEPEYPTAEKTTSPPTQSGNWHISLRFGIDSFRNGMDPVSFIYYLKKLGEIVSLTSVTEALIIAQDFDPESCYLGFEIDLKTNASKAELESTFEFVREDSLIHILPPDSSFKDYLNLIQALPEDDMFLGEILMHSGLITQRELEAGLRQQQNQDDSDTDNQPLGAILVDQQAVPRPLVDAALEKQKQNREQKTRETQSIRVDAERLDNLIDLVGELIIACASANVCAAEIKHERLIEANAEVGALVEQVRDSALQLRMVPIGATFSRFQRVVREISSELGKDIVLVIEGGDTEVDKSVVEKIGDPLTHLVRNAMDHGIETAEIRRQAGKPVQGTLKLNAYHDSGNLVIEVSDDGGGLRRDKILAKAIERGLIAANANLTEQEIYNLIFEPGFSTAEQLSNLSGRGVGMDVVKRNITALRGTIEIQSTAGIGTQLKIYLPLTLAIIEGFQVKVSDAYLIIPLNRILECVAKPEAKQSHFMDLRGEILPLIDLQTLFTLPPSAANRQNVVVVEYAGQKCGLIVDALLGEFQTVIKPLGDFFAHLVGVGGSTILGNGEIALILDIAGLMALQAENSHNALTPST